MSIETIESLEGYRKRNAINIVKDKITRSNKVKSALELKDQNNK